MAENAKRKKKNRIPEIILVVSALILGCLIVFFFSRSKTRTTTGPSEDRVITGAYPNPSEIVEADKQVYFAYLEVPGSIKSRIEAATMSDTCPIDIANLRYLKVLHWGYDGSAHQGELLVHEDIVEDVQEIFYELYKASYPIESMKLFEEYGGNMEVSMGKNNTAAFNAKVSRINLENSAHAYGKAIDLNPLYNPYLDEKDTIYPVAATDYADREKSFAHKIDSTDYAYKLFTEHGFSWGGPQNAMHFEK